MKNNHNHTYLPFLKLVMGLVLLTGSITTVRAQITFYDMNLVSQIGSVLEEDITTNSNPSALIGSTGGPQIWDFSQTPVSDYVRQISIISPTNGGYQSNFPQASYAEQYSDNYGIFQEQDYYSLSAIGRIYYGSYNSLSGINQYSPPATDIPPVIGYGSNWSYTTSVTVSPYNEADTVTAVVDAYGVLILPGIGKVLALRVNELTEEDEYYDGFGPLETDYISEYFWLVPGIGKAVDIVSQIDSSPPPAIFTDAYEIRRVFQVTIPSPASVSGLKISLKPGPSVLLNWNSASNGSTYTVQAAPVLGATNWQMVANPASNSWSGPAAAPQQFYEVYINP
jgi:hypothetical protein